MEDFVYKGKRIEFTSVTGTVLSSDKREHTETYTSTSGGGGYIHNGTGYINAPRTTTRSTTVTNHEFWLSLENGEERSIKLSGTDIPLREGQKVTMVSARKPGENSGEWTLLVNHSAGRYWNVLDAAGFIGEFDLIFPFEYLEKLMVSLTLGIPTLFNLYGFMFLKKHGFVDIFLATFLGAFLGYGLYWAFFLISLLKKSIESPSLRKRIDAHLDLIAQELFRHQ